MAESQTATVNRERAEVIEEGQRAGERQFCCETCRTPWEGFYNFHGMHYSAIFHAGYGVLAGGIYTDPDVCHSCGSMECHPTCVHRLPNWRDVLRTRIQQIREFIREARPSGDRGTMKCPRCDRRIVEDQNLCGCVWDAAIPY